MPSKRHCSWNRASRRGRRTVGALTLAALTGSWPSTTLAGEYGWHSQRAVELAGPLGSCIPRVLAVSNIAFPPGRGAKPSFVYAVTEAGTPFCPVPPTELRIATFNGQQWTTAHLAAESPDWVNQFDVYDLQSAGPNANIAIAYEPDGTLGIALEGSLTGGPFEVLYLSAAPAQCCECPGDVNGDGNVNGLDIQGFTNCQINGGTGAECRCADIDGDGDVDSADQALFIPLLLSGTCGTPQPCVGFDVGATVAAPTGDHYDYGWKALHMSPAGDPWIIVGWAHPDPQTTELGLAWRWDGVWSSAVGGQIAGYHETLGAFDPPLQGHHVTTLSIGPYSSIRGEYYPLVAYNPYFWAVGTSQIHPGISIDSFGLIDRGDDYSGCEGTKPTSVYASKLGDVVYDRYTGHTRQFCFTTYEVIAPGGLVLDGAQLYRGPIHQIVNNALGTDPAFLFDSVDENGFATGQVNVRWRDVSFPIHDYAPVGSFEAPFPRNLSMVYAPETGTQPFNDRPMAIIFYSYEAFNKKTDEWEVHDVAEVFWPEPL